MKQLRYLIEAALIWILFLGFSLLKPHHASAIGGWIGRSIGPLLAVNRKALRHLEQSLPDLPPSRHKEIICGMWDNLGRVFAEYPHLEEIAQNRVNVHGFENHHTSEKIAKVFVSAHLANWEICAAVAHLRLGIPLDLTYREPNNPWAARMLDRTRSLNGRITSFPKSRESGRLIIESLKKNRSIGILIDQKYNEGIESLFFSQPAMTNPIFVYLCQKFKCPMYMIKMVRRNGCNFDMYLDSEIILTQADGSPKTTQDIIMQANQIIENWIRQNPEQWIWLHKRWKS